ncbi:MAG TPA: carbohydrate ABC transporter permease [Acidimicrobiales bacterium]|nr:carbohydrate ABC transporter permease [Acidimicrobiales bacterium]
MRARLSRVPFWVMVGGFVVVSLFPFFWIVVTSLKGSQELSQGTHGLLPAHATLSAYRAVMTGSGFLRPLANSAIVSVAATVVSVVIGALAGYALARLRLPARRLIMGFVLLAGFFPILAMVGPLFLVYRRVGLLDSYVGLVIAYLVYTLPIATWLLTNYFSQLPADLEEAAMVDGATRLQALWRVVVPVALPGLFTAAILSFILAWNDFAFALSFLQSPSRFTAPLSIVNLGQSQFQVFYNRIDAAVVIITVPVAALVLVAQRRIVTGLTAGALR